ncbi:MAG: hypothetical protein KGO96_13915 [Elusimicrobia bacterium]|nr:hypothetical protein [Elusimicrobiota bacterium]MDE2426990.1 hypothetical protein [Elusimicrobiota bacterium]
MSWEIPKNVVKQTQQGPPTIMEQLQLMNEQLGSVASAVKGSPLEIAKAVKEALTPPQPQLPNRQTWQTPVGTNITDMAVGFLGRTLLVENATNQWWFVKPLDRFIQPYQTGLILPVPDGFQVFSLQQTAPVGLAQAGQIAGQAITITVDSREFLASPGVVQSTGGGGGGGNVTIVGPLTGGAVDVAFPSTQPVNVTGFTAPPQVQGTVAAGGAIGGNPVQMGGSDGTLVRELSVDTAGRANVNVNGNVAGITNPVTVAQATAANLNATVAGTVTANIGTGNLAGITGTVNTDASAARRGTLTDRSGTITTGGTAQQLAAANASRKYLVIQNQHATEVLWFNFTTTAVQSEPSFQLAAGGGSFVMEGEFVSTEAVSVIAATTGHPWTAKEG